LQDKKPVHPPYVTAGLIPAIHAVPPQEAFGVVVVGSAWMPGTRPGMTLADRQAIALTKDNTLKFNNIQP
jgi:hypothetical protein